MSSHRNSMQVINMNNKETPIYDNVHFRLNQKVYKTESQIIQIHREMMIVHIFKTEMNGFWLYFAIVPEVLKRGFMRKLLSIESDNTTLRVLRPDINFTLNGCIRFRYEGLRCYLITSNTRFEKTHPRPELDSKFWYLPKLSAPPASDHEDSLFIPKKQMPEVSVDLYYSIELKKTPIGEIRVLAHEQKPNWMIREGLGGKDIAVCEMITIQGIVHFICQDSQRLFDLLFSIRSNDLTIKSNLNLINKSTVRLCGLASCTINQGQENRSVYIVLPKTKSMVISPSFAQPHPTFVDLRDPELTRLFDKMPAYRPHEFALLSKASLWSALKSIKPDAQHLLSQLQVKIEVQDKPVHPPVVEPEDKTEGEFVTPKKKAKIEESDSNKNMARLLTTADSMSEDGDDFLPSSSLIHLNFDEEDSDVDPQNLVYDPTIASLGLKCEEPMPEAKSLKFELAVEEATAHNLIEQNVGFLEGRTLHSYFTSN